MNILRRKGKGLEGRFVNNHGWSNWGLQYQPAQVCQVSQVHKIHETNFVDLRYIIYDFKICEQLSKVEMIKILAGNFNFLNLPRNVHAK
jgi:hypothetical protein